MDSNREPERAFFGRLVSTVPEFKDAANEETSYYDEVIPHVLMANFTRWLIERYRDSRNGDPLASELVERVLNFLELEFGDESRPTVQELIAASFLDNLTQAGPDEAGIKRHLGPRLLRQLQWSEGPRPS